MARLFCSLLGHQFVARCWSHCFYVQRDALRLYPWVLECRGPSVGFGAAILVVATGLGAVLTASALAFNLIKWFGVGYLVYLAYKQWQQTTTEMPTDTSLSPRLSPVQLVGKGFLVNISNPKAIVFILAVLPQFLDPTQPLFTQYVAMTLTMVGVDMLVMAGYTGLAVKVLIFLKSPHQQKILNRSFAGLFLGAASALSLVHRSN